MSESSSSPVRSDKREQNMSRRRARIVAAARELIVETGTDGFSMKLLADRSDVSLATIYNLIGQKQDVLVQVFTTDMVKFEQQVSSADHGDPIDQFYDAITFAVRTLYRDAAYHRVLFTALLSPSGFELIRLFQQPRSHFWADVVGAAVRGGLLREGTDGAMISHVLDDMYRSALIRWLWQPEDEKHFRALVNHRFTIVLLGFATPAGDARLRPRLDEFRAAMAKRRKPAKRPEAGPTEAAS